MEHNLLTLDFWRDTVCYEGRVVPTGTLACAALNIPDESITSLTEPCESVQAFLATLNSIMPDVSLLPPAKTAAEQILKTLHSYAPFSWGDLNFYLSGLEKAFTEESIQELQAWSFALMTKTLTEDSMTELRHGILLGKLTMLLAQMADSLRLFKDAMGEFAGMLDADSADRSPDGLAVMFAKAFPTEASFTGTDWMSMLNATLQYFSANREDQEAPILVKRMHFVSFVGMLRADLFEGLSVGHAPKRCRICGKWFLTVNARHTKYCGSLAPGDKRGRTCRQIGNLQGRESRELAADHPLKQLYERRMNSIQRSVKRGKLDPELAEAMKRLAKDKLYKAISNNNYAQTRYEAEMEQVALLEEAKRFIS